MYFFIVSSVAYFFYDYSYISYFYCCLCFIFFIIFSSLYSVCLVLFWDSSCPYFFYLFLFFVIRDLSGITSLFFFLYSIFLYCSYFFLFYSYFAYILYFVFFFNNYLFFFYFFSLFIGNYCILCILYEFICYVSIFYCCFVFFF